MTTIREEVSIAVTASLLIGRNIVDFIDDLDVIAGDSKLKMAALASALAIIIAQEGDNIEDDTEIMFDLIPVLVDIAATAGDEIEAAYRKAISAGVLH